MSSKNRASFRWDDPLLLSEQLIPVVAGIAWQ